MSAEWWKRNSPQSLYSGRLERFRTDYTDADPDLEKDFYLLRHTSCPAVLTENLFMDNHADCDFLISPEGQQSLIDLHVDGINSFLNR